MTVEPAVYSRRAYQKQLSKVRRAKRKKVDNTSPPVPDVDLVTWIEDTLVVPSGMLQGQPFVVEPWQRQFLEGALADGVREGSLSCARKNGKSGLIAALMLGFTVGPLRTPGWRGIVTSLNAKLSAEMRDNIEAIALASGLEDALTVRRSPSPGHILGPDRTRVDFLSADRSSGHGVSADVALVDESGLMEERDRPLWDAMLTSVSARDGRMLSISIRGDSPMLSEVAERSSSPSVYWQEHAADPECDIMDEKAWAAANPGLGTIKSVSYMRDMAERAAKIPAAQANFRLLDLNTPGAGLQSTLVTPSEWQQCLVETLPEPFGPLVLGMDLGGSSSMCACVAYWPHSHRLQAWGAFPGEPDLAARGRADGVGSRYLEMEQRGELTVYPGRRSTPVEEFIPDILERLDGYKISRIIADTYRQAEAQDEFSKAGIKAKQEYRRPAVREGANDIRDFQKAVYDGRIKCRESKLIAQAIRDSRLSTDKWNNPMLDKSRIRGRIDVLSAAVMAVGVGSRIKERKRPAVRLYKA